MSPDATWDHTLRMLNERYPILIYDNDGGAPVRERVAAARTRVLAAAAGPAAADADARAPREFEIFTYPGRTLTFGRVESLEFEVLARDQQGVATHYRLTLQTEGGERELEFYI